MTYDKVKYNNQYNKENYARLSVQVPINKKEDIRDHWKRKGYDSFNAYVNDLIRKDMNENTEKVKANTVKNVKLTGGHNKLEINNN